MLKKEKRKNLNINEVEKLLKKKKIIFALRSGETKKYGAYVRWYLPLKKLFGQVILFDPRKKRFDYGLEAMKKMFLNIVIKEKPDYIFAIVGWQGEFDIDYLEKINEISPKTKIITFYGDDDIFFTSTRYYILFADYSLIAQPHYFKLYKKDGVKKVFLTVGLNTDYLKPINVDKKYDVTFVGTVSPSRIEIIRFLIKNGINVKIWGKGWYYSEFKDFYGRPPLSCSDDILKIRGQSKINLAFTKNRYGELHFKGRIFENAACKAFQLTEYFPEYLNYFKNNEELIMFKDNKDLLEKIKYYLKHDEEREKIAECAYKKMIKNYDMTAEFKQFFKKVLEDESDFSRKLPKLDKMMVSLSKNDLNKSPNEIKEKIKDADYICFFDGECKISKFKNYLQMYSLEKTKKDVSCCDYYAYSKGLGNYLVFNAYGAFKFINRKDFNKLLNLNQIVVTKNYFLKNLNKFKEFFYGKEVDLINEKNTAFVSIPLLKIKKFKEVNSINMIEEAFEPHFMLELYSLFRKKKLFFNKYFYKLLISPILINNFFIWKYLLKSLFNKENWFKIKFEEK